MTAAEWRAIAKALQGAADAGAKVLALCDAAGVRPHARQKPGPKPARKATKPREDDE